MARTKVAAVDMVRKAQILDLVSFHFFGFHPPLSSHPLFFSLSLKTENSLGAGSIPAPRSAPASRAGPCTAQQAPVLSRKRLTNRAAWQPFPVPGSLSRGAEAAVSKEDVMDSY